MPRILKDPHAPGETASWRPFRAAYRPPEVDWEWEAENFHEVDEDARRRSEPDLHVWDEDYEGR